MFWWFHNKCTIFLIQVPFVPSNHITWKGMNFRCGKLPHYIEYNRFIWGLTYSPTWYDQANCIQSVSSRDNNPGRHDPLSSISKFCWVEKRNLIYLMWSDLFYWLCHGFDVLNWCQPLKWWSLSLRSCLLIAFKESSTCLRSLSGRRCPSNQWVLGYLYRNRFIELESPSNQWVVVQE